MLKGKIYEQRCSNHEVDVPWAVGIYNSIVAFPLGDLLAAGR